MIITHNQSETKLYTTWAAMKQRCYNPKNPGYKNWGGRGIRVCDRWLNSFENFHADMGDKPEGMTLERIDNNDHYCPENCRWATHLENCRNTRKCRFVEYDGKKRTIGEWCQITGLGRQAIYERLKAKLPLHEVFNPAPRYDGGPLKKFLTYDGRTHSITEWAKILGVNRDSFAVRCWKNKYDPAKCLREIA